MPVLHVCLHPFSLLLSCCHMAADNPKTHTACGHHFHLPCLYEWLERKDTCPIVSGTSTLDLLKCASGFFSNCADHSCACRLHKKRVCWHASMFSDAVCTLLNLWLIIIHIPLIPNVFLTLMCSARANCNLTALSSTYSVPGLLV